MRVWVSRRSHRDRSPNAKTNRGQHNFRASPGEELGIHTELGDDYFRIPAANQAPPTLRIRRTGLAQSGGGGGSRKSSIRKSPFSSSGTPADGVLCSVNGELGSQISVAWTLW